MLIDITKYGYLYECDYCGTEFIGKIGRSYCSQSCAASSRTGENNSNWKGGREGVRQAEWIEKNREKRNASIAVSIAVRNGTLKKECCCICSADASDCDAHHEDYSKPLEVKWLCRKHHKELHMKKAGHTSTKTA